MVCRPGSDSGASDSHASDAHAGRHDFHDGGGGGLNSFDVFGPPPVSRREQSSRDAQMGITRDGTEKFSTNYDISNNKTLAKNTSGQGLTAFQSLGAEIFDLSGDGPTRDSTEVFIGSDFHHHGGANRGDGMHRNSKRDDAAAMALASKEMMQSDRTKDVKNYVATQIAKGDLTGMYAANKNGKPNKEHWESEIEKHKSATV